MVRFNQFKANYLSSGEAVRLLKKDVKEAQNCFKNQAYKAAMVLSGSILESILLDRLSVDPYIAGLGFCQVFNNMPPNSIEDWRLHQMLRVSEFLTFISHETYQLADLLRNYRNLIHPAAARRTQMNANKSRAQRALEAANQSLQDLDHNFQTISQDIYIINIANVPSAFISNPNTLQTAISNIAQQYGFTTHIVSTSSQLATIIQNPPAYSIIANTHGEIMPVPTGTNWQNHFQNLGNMISNSGSIFVNIGGYPFFYQGSNQPVGQAGLNSFLSNNSINANCMNATNATFTVEGRKIIQRLNMTRLGQALPANRSAIWHGVSQKIVFLGTGNLCGASAIRIGRGWFVNVGLGSDLGNPNATSAQLTLGDTILGNFGIGCALYVADRL